MGKEYRKQVEVVSTVTIPSLALLEDDFEATLLKWTALGTAGSATTRDTNIAYHGEASLKCITRDVGEVDGDQAYGQRYAKLTNRRFLNFKFVVKDCFVGSDGAIVWFKAWVRSSLGLIYFGLKLDDKTHKLYYINSANNWEELVGYTLKTLVDAWYSIEIQLDIINQAYNYILIGESSPDIKDIKCYHSPGVTNYSRLKIELGVEQNDAASGYPAIAYFDDVVITTPDQ